MSHSHPLFSYEILQYLQVSMTQILMDSALPWDPVHIKACVHPSRVGLCFPHSCGAPAHKPFWLSVPNALGVPPPNARPPGMGT